MLLQYLYTPFSTDGTFSDVQASGSLAQGFELSSDNKPDGPSGLLWKL